MAVAAPARKGAPAPAPSRTSPPAKKAAPARPVRHRPKPRGRAAAAPAPARKAPARRAPGRAPGRAKPKTKRVNGQLIPLAVGRTAVAVRQLPDSGLVVRMTRGRAWIGVLGLLLVGIVALNVVTLSFAASSGKIDEQITTLEEENGGLKSRDARLSGTGDVRNAAAPLGLAMPSSETIHFTDAGPEAVATAAQRLAAAGPG
ncbi:MAG TPA: hypothetical protein VHU86_03300 [Solirubrobacterales bacterium]|jgi:hypothetical protein|nr:hypothetical protein [Solirubrobacterales bacterium]